jgi:hypothetical protein
VVSRAAKEFLSELIDDPAVQASVRERVLAGDTLGFFRALEMIHGKAKQSSDVTVFDGYVLPAGDDIDDAED